MDGERLPFAIAPRRTVLEEPADEAIQAFRQAAEEHPHEPDYRFMLGEALLRAGRLDAAAVEMRAACALGPPNAEYLASIGAVLLESGKPDLAEQSFHAALRLEPGLTSALSRRAIALAQLGRAEEARGAADAACRLAPGSSEAARHRGIALWLTGESAAALVSLRNAARLAPDAPEPHHDLGLLLQATGRVTDAVACFEKTLDLDPAFLSVRPESREIVDRCRLQELRAEVARPRSAAGRGRDAAWAAVDALHDAASAGPRAARRLRSPAWLLAFLAVGYLAFRVVPPYAAHFRFQDRMREIARVPIHDDLAVHARPMREVQELGLAAYVHDGDCSITTGTSFRTIVCAYRRPIRLVPGFEPQLAWRARVEVAVIFGPDTIFF